MRKIKRIVIGKNQVEKIGYLKLFSQFNMEFILLKQSRSKTRLRNLLKSKLGEN